MQKTLKLVPFGSDPHFCLRPPFLPLNGTTWSWRPLIGQGGLGKMHQLFGAKMYKLIDELNEALAA